MIKRFMTLSLACVALGFSPLACTANVDDPDIDQQPDNSDDPAECVVDCDETRTTCVGSCDDDGCRATCETDHDECVTECE